MACVLVRLCFRLGNGLCFAASCRCSWWYSGCGKIWLSWLADHCVSPNFGQRCCFVLLRLASPCLPPGSHRGERKAGPDPLAAVPQEAWSMRGGVPSVVSWRRRLAAGGRGVRRQAILCHGRGETGTAPGAALAFFLFVFSFRRAASFFLAALVGCTSPLGWDA